MTLDFFEDYRRRLAGRLAQDPGLTEGEFDRWALELFRLQYAHVTPYRRLCDRLGRTPDGVTHWSLIPSVPAVAFKEFDLTSLPERDRAAVFHSSGTTGQKPSRHYHSQSSLRCYTDLVIPWFMTHLLPDRERLTVISLVPSVDHAPHSSLAHMMDSVLRRCGLPDSVSLGWVTDEGVWVLDLDGLVGRLQRQAAADAACLVAGTAYGFVHLLDHLQLRKLRLRLPTGSRLMETGGYKGRSRELEKVELHRRLTQALGVPESHIVSEYGMSELGSQAYDRRVGASGPRVFRFPSWCRVRVLQPGSTLPPPSGTPGLLTLFDLANLRSVLALQTEDLGVAEGEGFAYVGRARNAELRGCSRMHL